MNIEIQASFRDDRVEATFFFKNRCIGSLRIREENWHDFRHEIREGAEITKDIADPVEELSIEELEAGVDLELEVMA